MRLGAHVWPNAQHLHHNIGDGDSHTIQQSSFDTKQSTHVQQTGINVTENVTESVVSEYYPGNLVKLVAAGTKSTKENLVSSVQIPSQIETHQRFDTNQAVSASIKSPIDVPNFLSGFDKVSQYKQETNAPPAADSLESAQCSPAYHTSKSFDDFHRYLGKGLSPAVAPPPKFPALIQLDACDHTKIVRPVIPSIDSPDEVSLSNLKMRPRGQHIASKAHRKISTTNSKSCQPTTEEEKSNEILLTKAYAEAVRDSLNQSSRVQNTQGKTDVSCVDCYSVFAQESAGTIRQHSAAIKETDQIQNQQSDGTDFPLEGMTFEDFNTLQSYGSDKAATVSDPSDCLSEDPNSGSGGGTSDESDTHSESSRYNKKARLSGQSRTWGSCFGT